MSALRLYREALAAPNSVLPTINPFLLCVWVLQIHSYLQVGLCQSLGVLTVWCEWITTVFSLSSIRRQSSCLRLLLDIWWSFDFEAGHTLEEFVGFRGWPAADCKAINCDQTPANRWVFQHHARSLGSLLLIYSCSTSLGQFWPMYKSVKSQYFQGRWIFGKLCHFRHDRTVRLPDLIFSAISFQRVQLFRYSFIE